MNPVENQLPGCTLIATIIFGKGNKFIQGNFRQVSNSWNFILQTHFIQSIISPFTEFMLPLFILQPLTNFWIDVLCEQVVDGRHKSMHKALYEGFLFLSNLFYHFPIWDVLELIHMELPPNVLPM